MGNSVSHCEPEIVAVRIPSPWEDEAAAASKERGDALASFGATTTMGKKKKKKKKKSLDCYGCGGNESARPPLHTLLSLLLAPFSRHHRAQHDVLSSSCVVAC